MSEEEKQQELKEKQTQEDKEEEDTSSLPIEFINIDMSKLKEVKRPGVDLREFAGRPAKIADVRMIRLHSPYAKAEDKKSHSIRLIGEIVGEREINNEKRDIFATELIGVEEDEEGNLLGLPEGEKSKWQRLKKFVENQTEKTINTPEDLIGVSLTMKVNDKGYLGFMY